MWKPDQMAFNDPSIVGEASGVLWGGNGYLPWPQLVAITSALPSPARGAFLARASDGTLKPFIGTATKLYRVDSSTTITDVTRSSGGDYAVATDRQWSFAQFRTASVNYLIAVNGVDANQFIDVDAGTNFAALAGSPPIAGVVRTFGTQLFLFRLPSNTNRMAWSGRGDATFWTFGQRDCDKQDFSDGGEVVGLTSMEAGRFVFQRAAVRKMTPVTSRAIYQYDRVENARGLAAPGSLVELGQDAFWYADEGFFSIGRGRIGVNEIDAWFKSNANLNRLETMVSAVDPASHHVFWLFPTSGVSSAVLDHVLCYDIVRQAWTHAPISASYIMPGATLGYTVETLDALLTSLGLTMDTATSIPLDATWLSGGALTLAAIDGSNKLAFFTGSAMAATLETADFQPVINRRSYVRGISPITDNAAAQVTLATKESLSQSLSYNAAQTVNARMLVSPLKSGRICRVRVSHAAGDMWSHTRGCEVDAIDDGEI